MSVDHLVKDTFSSHHPQNTQRKLNPSTLLLPFLAMSSTVFKCKKLIIADSTDLQLFVCWSFNDPREDFQNNNHIIVKNASRLDQIH